MINPCILRQNFIYQLDKPFLGCDHQYGFIFLLSINLGSLLKESVDAIDMVVNLSCTITTFNGHMKHCVQLPRNDLFLLAL